MVKRLSAATLIGCLLAAQTASGVPPKNERWRRARTKNFTIISNDHPHDIEEVARGFERFHAFMLTREQAEGPQPPTTILLFHDEASFAPYKTDKNGNVLNFVGLFTETRYGNYIAMRETKSANPHRIVYHEYTHYYHSRSPIPIPLWFTEGMAEYMSTFWSSGYEVRVGILVDAHVELLRRKPLMALGELFAMTPSSQDYNEGERQGIFYAQSWALHHYMVHGRPELLEKHKELLLALGSGSSAKEAFEAVYGIDYRSVQNGLEDYVRQGRFKYYEYDGLELQVDDTFEMRDMPRAELLAVLGTYLADTAPWQSKAAEEHLRESLALAPEQPHLIATLGQVLAQQERTTEATQHFERAIELAPNDAMTYARCGNDAVDRFMATHARIPSEPDALPQPLAKARKMLSTALQLDPTDAEALVSLGKTYLFDPEDVAIGLQTLAVARQQLPGRMDIAYYMVLLLLRAGDHASAEALVHHTLAQGTNAELHKAAQDALDDHSVGRAADRYRDAVYAFNSGEYARAIAILERLLPTVDDPQLRGATKELLGKARAAQQEQAEVNRTNEQIARYNTAVDKANAGDLAAAEAILEALVDEIDDPELANSARSLLQDVRSMLTKRARRR